MVMVGFDTLPSRMTGLPAIRPSEGFVMSRSSPRSPFSPGAPFGQSSITCVGSEAQQSENARTEKHRSATIGVSVDFMRRSETKVHRRVETFPRPRRSLLNGERFPNCSAALQEPSLGARPVPGRSAHEDAKAPGLIRWLSNKPKPLRAGTSRAPERDRSPDRSAHEDTKAPGLIQ